MQSRPVPVSRLSLAELGEYPRAFLSAAAAAGHPQVADHNRPGALGVGPLPRNVRNGTRMSTALTYLAPARPRPNLEIRPDTLVDRVLLKGASRRGRRSRPRMPPAGGALINHENDPATSPLQT